MEFKVVKSGRVDVTVESAGGVKGDEVGGLKCVVLLGNDSSRRRSRADIYDGLRFKNWYSDCYKFHDTGQ